MMTKLNNLPSFIGIGAMRCGTTWLTDQLRSHPEIHVPSHYKEVHFFDRYYDKGMDWYLSNFNEKRDDQIVGEFTPFYMRDPMAMERLARHCPDAKLIVSLRNPVERALSHYTFLKNRKNLSESFYEALQDERFDILEAGLYGKQLDLVLKLFPRQQLHVISFDDIKASPQRVTTDLYTFLGVEPGFINEALGARSNAGHGVRSMLLARIMRKAKHTARHFTSGRRKLSGLGFFKLGKLLNRLNATEAARVEIDEKTRKFLTEFYTEDLEMLRTLLGDAFQYWDLEQ